MAVHEQFLAELSLEAPKTIKMLERVPAERFAWKPHEKSMTVGRLASHIAEAPIWFQFALTTDSRDTSGKYIPFEGRDVQDIVSHYSKGVEEAKKLLSGMNEEALEKNWSFRSGEKIIFEMPRKDVLRNYFFNHQVHHRGQLSVYLRLLNVPVPGMYGRSADEK